MLFSATGASEAPLSPADLTGLLADGEPLWVVIDRSCAGIPFIQSEDGLQLAPPSAGPLSVCVRDEGGNCQVELCDPSAPDVIARVTALWRGTLRYRLDKWPWTGLIARGELGLRLWPAANLGYRGFRFGRWFAGQFRLAEPAASSRDQQAEIYSTLYNQQFYRELAEGGLTPNERLIADQWLKPGMRILDVGCGSGREAFGFADLGTTVTGIDIAESLIRIGQELLEQKGVESVKLQTEAPEGAQFDVVYLAKDIYSRTPGRRNRVEMLKSLAAHLDSGGVMFIPAHLQRAERCSVKFMIDGHRALLRPLLGERVPESNDRWISDRNFEDAGPVSFKHRFQHESELIGEIEAARLSYVERLDDFVVARRS